MIYTGIDGNKRISINYSPLKKEWEFSRRDRKYIDLEVHERYGDVVWDVDIDDGTVYLVMFKDFEIPGDYFALDAEVFSLGRVLRANGRKEGVVLDIGSKKILRYRY